MQILKGIPVAPGVAIARPFVLEPEGRSMPLRQTVTPAEHLVDVGQFRAALAATEAAIRKTKVRLEGRLGVGHGAILDAHLQILKDPLLVDATIEEARKEQANIAWAFDRTMRSFSRMISSAGDEYLRERTSDVEDVARQVLKHLSGQERRLLEDVKDRVIVLADDLSPSETSDIPRDRVVGFATVAGSRTSHTAIIAQALDLPALVAVTGLREAKVSDVTVILDGIEGLLILDPDAATIERYKRLQRMATQRRKDMTSLAKLPARTPDGHKVDLLANLEMPLEAEAALNGGAEGIGLYRTEFLFLNREKFPTEDEQFQWYRKVVSRMAPRPVVIRTLDLGGDKFVESQGEAKEMNPFLGLRGIRMCLANREVFRTQLRAILRASAHGTVEMMFPMISSVEEFRQAVRCVEEAKTELRSDRIKFRDAIPVGAMIETPSAALVSDLLAREAAFFSIGSNDLIQYSIAVDRGNQSASYLYEPLHPAILRLIRTVIESGHAGRIRVTVCGEIAADPLSGVLLLGLGLDAFSVSPVSLAQTKRLIRSVPFAEARALAVEALTLPTAQAVKELVRGRLGDRVTAAG